MDRITRVTRKRKEGERETERGEGERETAQMGEK